MRFHAASRENSHERQRSFRTAGLYSFDHIAESFDDFLRSIGCKVVGSDSKENAVCGKSVQLAVIYPPEDILDPVISASHVEGRSVKLVPYFLSVLCRSIIGISPEMHDRIPYEHSCVVLSMAFVDDMRMSVHPVVWIALLCDRYGCAYMSDRLVQDFSEYLFVCSRIGHHAIVRSMDTFNGAVLRKCYDIVWKMVKKVVSLCLQFVKNGLLDLPGTCFPLCADLECL